MNNKQLRWFTVALIAFNMVWGMGNVVNNYAQQGVSVVTSWLLILAIYFIPYALIVGQLGSAFKDSKGGVSSWVENTTSNKRLAYSLFGTKTSSHPDCRGLGGPRKWKYRKYDVSPNGSSYFTYYISCLFIFINKRTFYVESNRRISRNSDVRYVDLIYSFSSNGTVHQPNDGICHTAYESSENIYSNL